MEKNDYQVFSVYMKNIRRRCNEKNLIGKDKAKSTSTHEVEGLTVITGEDDSIIVFKPWNVEGVENDDSKVIAMRYFPNENMCNVTKRSKRRLEDKESVDIRDEETIFFDCKLPKENKSGPGIDIYYGDQECEGPIYHGEDLGTILYRLERDVYKYSCNMTEKGKENSLGISGFLMSIKEMVEQEWKNILNNPQANSKVLTEMSNDEVEIMLGMLEGKQIYKVLSNLPKDMRDTILEKISDERARQLVRDLAIYCRKIKNEKETMVVTYE